MNLFFKMHTIPYRYILIRYCTLSYKKRFCDKESFRCPKNELFVKTSSLLGEISYGGRQNVLVNLFINKGQSLIGIYSLDIVLYHTKNDFVIKKF